MTALLDTHALLWAFIAPKTLGKRAAEIIAEESNTLLVSAASAWEIATKVRKGTLPEARDLERHFLEALGEAGYTLIPIEAATALRAARFTAAHRDPFDRILAAQAISLDIPILSKDPQLDVFGIRRIW